MSASSPLWTPDQQRDASRPPLSQRKALVSIVQQQRALVTLTRAVSTFFRMGFRQRIAWLLFGVRIFGPTPAELEAAMQQAQQEQGE